jgi:cytochrome c oxidase subunit 3
MSHTTTPNVAPQPGTHDENHAHPRFLAHHFGSAQQQFDAGKFGMWLFLITEVLFFSGLFCAYAIFRSTHAAAFANADKYLDSTLGATNTAVLLFSSLTMAWAVRASQLGQQKLLVKLLTITLACASIFLGVKAVEYSHKWDLGILWASQFNPLEHAVHSSALLVLSIPAIVATVVSAIVFAVMKARRSPVAAPFWGCLTLTAVAFFAGVGIGQGVPLVERAITGSSHDEAAAEHHAAANHNTMKGHDNPQDHGKPPVVDTPAGPPGAESHPSAARVPVGAISPVSTEAEAQIANDKTYTGIFFSIYYVMTGLHAIHILAGMGAISWLLWRSLRGDFGPDYFGPVDYVGLYWHLVDLIWIYLFPLLYLIG